MTNRFMLAPLTNSQSNDDGTMSEEEFHWLTMRAKGGFGLTMTCAAHVQEIGRGFPGQMGIFSDQHLPGLTRLAAEIGSHNSISIVQLHHAGMRSPAALIGERPVCPSDNERDDARGLTLDEVYQLRDDFVQSAIRAEKAGFDGVELHGAHGYILCQFLSSEINHRVDQYGGELENRCRLLKEIIQGIRASCSPNFVLGVRLSPERFGMQLFEIKELAQNLMTEGDIDFLDMSLWDVFKEPNEEKFQGKTLLAHFAELDRGSVKLGVAGKITNPGEAEAIISQGVDWIMLGRAAILHHNFPELHRADPDFMPVQLPVSEDYLRNEGLSDKFLDYMRGWDGFILD
ncbi:MAG TPA: NADH:flavin oxidoreductase [Dehalococcoidia bacterium]|nr:NADH:flavin oxidoreductase [Dehalococcoidia bacterium]